MRAVAGAPSPGAETTRAGGPWQPGSRGLVLVILTLLGSCWPDYSVVCEKLRPETKKVESQCRDLFGNEVQLKITGNEKNQSTTQNLKSSKRERQDLLMLEQKTRPTQKTGGKNLTNREKLKVDKSPENTPKGRDKSYKCS